MSISFFWIFLKIHNIPSGLFTFLGLSFIVCGACDPMYIPNVNVRSTFFLVITQNWEQLKTLSMGE